MIKGIKVEFTNTTANVGTTATVHNMYSIPTGKTFVLTDLVVTPTAGVPAYLSAVSAQTLKLFDYNGLGATAASGNSTCRLHLIMDMVGSNPTYTSSGKVLHFTNGPEFTNGITPQAANANIFPTNGVWVAGYLR